MSTLCQLVQEYLCILQKYRDKHVLTTADLYFPASWTLAEKLRHPLSRLHVRVDRYDTDVWRRAQRLLNRRAALTAGRTEPARSGYHGAGTASRSYCNVPRAKVTATNDTTKSIDINAIPPVMTQVASWCISVSTSPCTFGRDSVLNAMASTSFSVRLKMPLLLDANFVPIWWHGAA
ncbi:MAG: DUF3445 domain-containing protein [Rhodobacteraceae bacterium]|nr:DUF3445 domain-containing protein [Paracoccaceae bacterium]